MQSIIASPADGARLHVVGDTVRVLASAAQTGGNYEIFELEGPEGSGPPPHAHPWAEAYVVIDGEADVLLDGKHLRAVPGCFIQVPAGTLHSYRIATKSAKFVVITSPSGASSFFSEVDAETDMGRITEVAVKHGFKVSSRASGAGSPA